ncbi:astacin [Teladorsagia circumcincta]|uniref:Metalloendopeptidase n=1 Tax=Teladorsagia circumcincta TaxID=45464 RepID=A0A2G9V1N2_TELCI|nr:astacin [Teladorsagia circumcincta]
MEFHWKENIVAMQLATAFVWFATVLVIDSSKPDAETVLNEDDFRSYTQRDITKLGIKVKDDPTMGNKMEGDIAIENLKKFVADNNRLGRNAIRQAYRRWPHREIPYTLSSQYGSYARSVIAKAMQAFLAKKRFVKVEDIETAISDFFDSRSPQFWEKETIVLPIRTGGRQPVSLDSGCIQVGTIVHELMHAVGFFHEQSRQDRDEYIEIVWRNVQNGADDQFEKYNMNVIDHLHEPYDYSSIMHYGPYAFSGSGRKTILPRKSGAERMGQRIAFSEGDIRKINKLYQCSTTIHGNSITENDQDPCYDDNWRCPFWALFSYCEDYEEIKYILDAIQNYFSIFSSVACLLILNSSAVRWNESRRSGANGVHLAWE